MELALVIYVVVAALAVAVLVFLHGTEKLRARRTGSRDTVLGNRYLQIVMMALMTGDEEPPRFPLIRLPGARKLLAETIAGVVSVTYGLDPAPLRRIVVANGLEEWLLRRVRQSQGFRRARYLSLLSSLSSDEEVALHTTQYVGSRNRYVRFQALMVKVAADPSTALRLMTDYPHPFTSCEIAEIMTMLRRGMLPIAYEPLMLSPNRNLRKVGLGIVRQFGIEESEKYLLRIIAEDTVPELGREALYTLCSLRRPLARREIASRIAVMEPAERRALLRYMAREGYAPDALQRMLDETERPYYESLVQSYKRCLA